MKEFVKDPIFKTGAGEWYFYDKTGILAIGPFDTKEKAKKFKEYCEKDKTNV